MSLAVRAIAVRDQFNESYSASVLKVEITCRDAGVPSRTSTRRITIRVTDDNDNTPQLDSDVFTVDVHENNHVGGVILAVNASDLDEGRNAALTYRLEPLDGPQSSSEVVSIDLHSGVIRALTTFDFESRQTYSYLMTRRRNLAAQVPAVQLH